MWLWIAWAAISVVLLLWLRHARVARLHRAWGRLMPAVVAMAAERAGAWSGHDDLAKLVVGSVAACALLLAFRRRDLSRGASLGAAAAGSVALLALPLSWTVSMLFLLSWGVAASALGDRAAWDKRPVRRDALDIAPPLAALAMASVAFPSVELAVALAFAPLSFGLNDIFASELGPLLPGRARLPPRFRPVPHGTPGAVSAAGTLLGALGCALAASAAWAYADAGSAGAVFAGGLVAGALDSWLSGSPHLPALPRRNEVVNAIASACAALIGLVA